MKTKNNPDKERKTPEEIKLAILTELNKGPKSTSELAQIINSNWLTTEKFLSELIQEKRIIELISASKSKVYASVNDPAFFYLPLSEETRDKTASLLKTIYERWKEKTGKIPQKTILQKLAVEFVEQNKLEKEIPIARFHYGQTLTLRYEENVPCQIWKLNEQQNISLDILINKFSSLNTSQAKNLQYEKPLMRFYRNKENVLKDFSNKENLKKSLADLLISYPSELTESFEMFDRLTFCIRIAARAEDSEDYLMELREFFSIFWNFLTSEIYFIDLEHFIPEGKKELFFQIKSNYLNMNKNQLKETIKDFENQLIDLNIPSSKEIEISDFVSELLQE